MKRQIISNRTKRPVIVDAPEPSEEILQQQEADRLNRLSNGNREFRNSLLTQSDWTQLPDAPLETTVKDEWSAYRQSLRDITLNASWPELAETDWPTDPNGETPTP